MSMKDFINTVPGENQLKDSNYLSYMIHPNAVKKVLIVGNSITRHNPKADIGWFGDWGMAASCAEKDYVHILHRRLIEYFGAVSICVAQAAVWEVTEPALKLKKLQEKYMPAAEFDADLIIVRIGENIKFQDTNLMELANSFQELIAFLGGDKPNTKVILTGLFWNFADHEAAVKQALIGKPYHFVPLVDLGMDETMTAIGLFEHAGVAGHPGDLGMEHIAERIMQKVKDIYPENE